MAKSKDERKLNHIDRTCAVSSTTDDWFGKTVGSDKISTGTYIQGPNVSCQTRDNERHKYTICICKGNLCNMVRFLFNIHMIIGVVVVTLLVNLHFITYSRGRQLKKVFDWKTDFKRF